MDKNPRNLLFEMRMVRANMDFITAEDGVKALCEYLIGLSKEVGEVRFYDIKKMCNRIKKLEREGHLTRVLSDKEIAKQEIKINLNEALLYFVGVVNCIQNAVLFIRNSVYHGYDDEDKKGGDN